MNKYFLVFIGGGGFLLYYNKHANSLKAFDGRETAPQSATADMFLDKEGKALEYKDALKGGLSVGTPGLLRMLKQVHKAHGKLAWAALFDPAITLAEQGFPLSTHRDGRPGQRGFRPGEGRQEGHRQQVHNPYQPSGCGGVLGSDRHSSGCLGQFPSHCC